MVNRKGKTKEGHVGMSEVIRLERKRKSPHVSCLPDHHSENDHRKSSLNANKSPIPNSIYIDSPSSPPALKKGESPRRKFSFPNRNGVVFLSSFLSFFPISDFTQTFLLTEATGVIYELPSSLFSKRHKFP